jgi:hypothetical protein
VELYFICPIYSHGVVLKHNTDLALSSVLEVEISAINFMSKPTDKKSMVVIDNVR